MKGETNNTVKIAFLAAACILVNLAGKSIAVYYSLPLWMDALGTIVAAYVLGPFCGAVVGCTANLIYGFQNPSSVIYALTSIAIGIVVGLSARQKKFDTLFGTMTVSSRVTAVSILISTPLNVCFYGGMTGNAWGDAVIEFLLERRFYSYLCYILGEFYVDFLDKVLTMLVLFFLIRLRRFRKKIVSKKKEETVAEKVAGSFLLLAALLMAFKPLSAYAAVTVSEEKVDFYSYVQTIYSGDNGLLSGEANDIAQTKDGILWIGTYAGLYRYNGSEFHSMNEFESVKNVNCLYVDEEGRLWIGTNDNGLSVSIGENIVNVLDISGGLPSNSIRSIIQCSDGNYYIGTSDAIQVLTLSGGIQLLEQIPEVIYAHDMSADEDGRVAAVTASGSLYLMRDRKVLSHMQMGKGSGIYTCCTFGEDGRLYVGTSENKMYVFDVSKDTFVQKKTVILSDLRQINSLFFAKNGIMFVCADNGIAYVSKGGDCQRINTNLFQNSVDHMLMDYQGNYWFTSSRLGLLRLAKSAFSDVYGFAGQEPKVVNTITRWKGLLYVGTDTGLDIIDPEKNRVVKDPLQDRLEQTRIRCMKKDSEGKLWISTYGQGLLRVKEDGEVKVFNSLNGNFCDWVRVTMELSDGTIVSAGDAGIAYIRNDTIQKLVPYGKELCSSMILCLLETQDGKLLAGSDGDGIVVLQNGEKVDTINHEDGLSSGVILRIVESANKEGYYIVASNGLQYMDRNFKVRSLNHFPYSNNYDVFPMENGRVFVLSSAGVYVIDEAVLLSNQTDMEYELLNSKRGLAALITVNSWNYLDDNARLYLSSDKGVFSLDVMDYGSMQKSYRMKLGSVLLDGERQHVERGSAIEIARDVTRIELFPEIINFTLEEPYVSYQLIGYDKEEIVIPFRELAGINYTNLPSGEYTFFLKVLDKDRHVLEESSYVIMKEKKLYDTRGFLVYLLLVGGLAITWFTWFITRTQIQRTLDFQRKELDFTKQQVNFQQKELEFAKQQVQMGNETILAIAKAVDAKDENTSLHSKRVSDYSVMIAKRLGFSDDECENLRKAALLHDIGKIGIPDKVLNKPGKLTEEEYALMKSHVTRGGEILKDFTMVEHVADGALYHHERYDGTGYPDHKKGEEIPLYGRIIGVADAFDAMTQNRVYRKKLSIDYVLNELERCKGTQFDPKIADLMIGLVNDGSIDLGSENGKERTES